MQYKCHRSIITADENNDLKKEQRHDVSETLLRLLNGFGYVNTITLIVVVLIAVVAAATAAAAAAAAVAAAAAK